MSMEILQEFSTSNDRIIVKRKRTKRSRPASSSATSSSAGTALSTSTEEEEDDMAANCLILLARGGAGAPPQVTVAATAVVVDENNKFTSRKFSEMITTAKGKVGMFVYECKTCNRSFPSFQALGGHRASHKKPKTAITGERSPPCDQEEVVSLPPITSTELGNNNKNLNIESKNKIHECSICGSEFGSGQALGGHMRRHRSGPSVVTTTTTNNRMTSTYEVSDDKGKNIFALDLNLPAPPEDDRLERSFVFSAASTMVDCHY